MIAENEPVQALSAKYIAYLLRWAESGSNSKVANPLFDRLQELQKSLRETAEGRQTIRELADSTDPRVRLMSAAHMLAFDPESAILVLEELQSTPGLHAVSAKYTLRSFHAGTLNLDW